jgi:hypothetical protein
LQQNNFNKREPILSFGQKNYRDWSVIAVGVLELKALLFIWGFSQFGFKATAWDNWYSIWNRWDSVHYQRIAEHFYTQANIPLAEFQFLSHFPPLYPSLMAALHWAGLPLVFAAFAITITAAVLGSCLLYELVLLEFNNRAAAFRAVIFMNIFPTAYFTNTPYSDSLYIALTLLAFYCLRTGKQVHFSALTMGFAILTRVVGITLIPVLLVSMAQKFRQKELSYKQVAALLFPIGAFLLYLLLNYLAYGNPLFFLVDSANQAHTVKLGFLPFRETITTLLTFYERPATLIKDHSFMINLGWNSAFVLMATFLSLCFIKKLPAVYSVYAFGYLFFISSMSWAISNARYVLAIFPIYIGLGLIENRVISMSIMAIYIAGLLYFSRIFVLGSWAF